MKILNLYAGIGGNRGGWRLTDEDTVVAICGRINERCKGYWVQLKYEKDRNYRMKDRR